jgi:signal transduction histidine kinase/DNA-binding response OmpR family regulator
VALARADRVLFDAAEEVRVSISRVQTALVTMDAPQAIVEVSRADAAHAYGRARRILEETAIPGRPGALRDVDDAWNAAEYQQSVVDHQVRTPRAVRDIRFTRRWRDAVLNTVGALNAASVAIGNIIRLKEPVVAELAYVRRQAWAIRDAYGEQCSLLHSFVATGASLDMATSSEWNGKVGAYRSGWEELDAYLRRPAADPRLREATRAARKITDDMQRDINAVVWTLGEPGKKALSGEEWAALCHAPFDSIVGIGQLALDQAIDYADDRRRSAAATLGAVLVGILISLGFAIYAIWIVRERFSRPMRSIVGTIDELSQRNFSATVEYAHRRDELGAVARSLKLLQSAMRRNAELEAESLQDKQREREARLAAEAANRAKSVFLANMSHELRTPLNAILGFSQLMDRDGAIPAEQRENLGIIRGSGEHLLALINDVLDMAKIEAGKHALVESDVDLLRLVDDVAEMMRQRAESKGLAFVLERHGALPRYVCADGAKLRQILINLIGNAVKFSDAGGVNVDVQLVRTEADEAGMRHWMRFGISDSGCGIAPGDLEHIFEPFVQAGRGKADGGTGLGLAITRQFVRLMGGDIRVSSRLGEGSVFSVELPLREGKPVMPETAQPRVIGLAPGQAERRILVVDDSEPNRLLLAKLLRAVGLEVRDAADGRAAVALAEQWRPHLIWMDLRMPVLDGYEATRIIKSRPWGRDIVIVALTSSILPDEFAEVLSLGCTEVLRKPYRERDIFDAMERCLHLRYLTSAAADGASMASNEADMADDDLPAQLATVDPASTESLRKALQSGDLSEIARAIECLSERHPALGAKLDRMARRFRFREMLAAMALAEG